MTRWSACASGAPALGLTSMSPAPADAAAGATVVDTAAWAWRSLAMVHLEHEADTLQFEVRSPAPCRLAVSPHLWVSEGG